MGMPALLGSLPQSALYTRVQDLHPGSSLKASRSHWKATAPQASGKDTWGVRQQVASREVQGYDEHLQCPGYSLSLRQAPIARDLQGSSVQR